MSIYGTSDYYARVAAGEIDGSEIWSAMGERESMGTNIQGEDIWRGNELSPSPTDDDIIPTPPAIGEQMTVVSENNNDRPAGNGVHSIRIHYLDAAGDQQTEDITMDGTSEVDTVATDIRFVNDMYSLTTGSNGVARDHIKIFSKADTGLVYNMIHKGGNKSLVPHRMVPTGKMLILKGWHATEPQGKRIAFRIRSTDMYGVLIENVFCFKDTAYIKLGETGNLPLNINVPALSIVKISGWADQSAAEAGVGWWGELKNID